MLVNSFHEVINPPEQRRKKKKQLPTMCAPRRLSVNSIHRARAIVLNKANPRSRVISRQRAVPLQHQQPDDQQQQQQKLAEMVPKKKERLNFDNEPLQQVQQHQQVQQQNGEPGQLDEDVNVTTLTTGALEIVEENTPSPIVRPPRRAAAQAASQRFVLQCKPKHQHTVQQQQLPKRPRRAQLDNVPTHLINESAQLDDEPTTTPLASPPPPPATKTGKQIRQQRKNVNRKNNPRVLISVHANVPANVQPIVVNDRRKYSVDAVLAVFTLPRPPPELEQKGYYLKWRGFTNQESWVLSQDSFCLEMAAAFSEKIGLEATLDAMLGNEIGVHLLQQLQQSEKFARVRSMYNVPALREARFDIAWSEHATPQVRQKAISQLPAFIKIMEEAPPTTNEEEEEEEDD